MMKSPRSTPYSFIPFSTSSPSKFTITRHHYSDTDRFEQSLDIYHPPTKFIPSSPPSTPSKKNHPKESPIIIVLVVGSAWLGHYWWIYAATSWWNASGPRTVVQATQTTTCCIRHRGRFCIGHGPTLHGFVALLWSGLGAWWMVLCNSSSSSSSSSRTDGSIHTILSTAAASAFVLYATYSLYFHPVPTISDMTLDVETALEWIHARYPDRRIVFGGYSSGGHVAACTLAAKNDERHPPSWRTATDAILYISPVLSVPATTTTTNSSFASLFLVRTLLTLIWGSDWRHTVPSPLHNNTEDDDVAKNLPHWIVACHSEVPFAAHLLDPLLCGAAYHAKIQQLWQQQQSKNNNSIQHGSSTTGTPATSSSSSSVFHALVTTNHWTMLASTEFHRLVQETLWEEIRQVVVAGAQATTTQHRRSARHEDDTAGID